MRFFYYGTCKYDKNASVIRWRVSAGWETATVKIVLNRLLCKVTKKIRVAADI